MSGLLLQVISFVGFVSVIFSDEIPANPMKLICSFSGSYYNNVTFTPEMIDATLCTHIQYDFAILNDLTHQIDFEDKSVEKTENLYERITALKDKNPNLKIILSLGGWNDSTKKYSDLVADQASRAQFVGSVVPFLQKYGFDGLDIAWEYPNCWQGNCGIKPDDVTNFVTFLTELRASFELKSLLLTASVSAVREEIDEAYDVPKVSKLLDHINVMSYDFHGGWEKTTGHHSQFFRHREDFKPSLNLNDSINHWIYRGVDQSKLIIGIPSYGRSFTLVDPNKNGLYAPALGPGKSGPRTNERGLYGFHEICEDLDSWKHFEDHRVGTYAVKGDQWVGFDSPKTVVAKARFIKQRGLGGAGYKTFFTDDYRGSCFGYTFPILRSIQYGLMSAEEKEFETSETNTRAFVEKIQLSILVNDEQNVVDKEKKQTGADDDEVLIKLTETEVTDSGEVEVKELEVNAGTLTATGDQDARTLAKMHIGLTMKK